MLAKGRVVEGASGRVLGPSASDPGGLILIDGQPMDPRPAIVLMLHKPSGFVCSRSEPGQSTVFDLLPQRFRLRSPLLSPVGRLDKDTTGLLLLTDHGQLLHRLTHPRHHVAKKYEAELARTLSADALDTLREGGLCLRGEPQPLRPAAVELVQALSLQITLSEGRYHQVRRMIAAVGSHVETLHRSTVGDLTLDGLTEGQWRRLESAEIKSLAAQTGLNIDSLG